jgi:hypothetical protein
MGGIGGAASYSSHPQKPKLTGTERRLVSWSNQVEVKVYKIWLMAELQEYLLKNQILIL